MELNNLLHGFLLTGDRSVETVAVTARLVMKQTADFLEKFVNINNSLSQLSWSKTHFVLRSTSLVNLSLYWWRRRWLLRTLILTSGTAEWWRPAEQSMFCPDRKPDWRHLYHYTIINVLSIFLFFKINYRKFKQQEYHSANIHGKNIFLFNCFLNSRIPPQSLKLTKSSMLYN